MPTYSTKYFILNYTSIGCFPFGRLKIDQGVLDLSLKGGGGGVSSHKYTLKLRQFVEHTFNDMPMQQNFFNQIFTELLIK